MLYCTAIAALAASALEEVEEKVQSFVEPLGQEITAAVVGLLRGPVTPAAVRNFEERLAQLTGEVNRQVVEFTYNQAEPEEPEPLPHHLWFEGCFYRRLNQKTRNAHVATRFGKIVLWRFAYRDDQTGGSCLFLLERQLGLVEGATPALADRVARAMAETGATQQRVLAWLRAEHGVDWGVKKLRAFTQTQAERMEPFRQACSAARLLELLEQAGAHTLRTDAPWYVRVRAWRAHSGGLALHWVNYRQVEDAQTETPWPVGPIAVECALPPGQRVEGVEWRRPEAGQPSELPHVQAGGCLRFTVPQVVVYGITVLRAATDD